MGEHDDAGMVLAQLADVVGGEALVHLAMALPGDDLDLGLGGDVLRQIFVRQHDDALDAERLDDLGALPEVQQMSDSAFTAAEVLT